MREDLEEKLVTAYPELFDRIREHPTTKQKYYGCSCGDGWFPIIDALCGLIAQRLRYLRVNGTPLDFKIFQIKEKFGGLRFYTQGGDQYIEGAIDMAEEMAARTCDVTGKPGQLYRKPSGWLVTLCPEEAEKVDAKPYVWPKLEPPAQSSN